MTGLATVTTRRPNPTPCFSFLTWTPQCRTRSPGSEAQSTVNTGGSGGSARQRTMPKRSDRSSSNKEDARIVPNGRGVSKSDRTPRGGVSSAKPGGRSPRNEREAERTHPSKKQSDGITTSSGVDSAKPASSARADRDAHASPVIKCDECGKTDKLLRCSQCKRAWYCGAEWYVLFDLRN